MHIAVDTRGRRLRTHGYLAAAMALFLILPTAATAMATTAPATGLVSVIVREARGAGNAPERAVARAGGSIGQQIRIIRGFAAAVPASRIGAIIATPGVLSVTPDAGVTLLRDNTSGDGTARLDDAAAVASQDSVDGYPVRPDMGSLYNLTKMIGARDYWERGYTGRGVDVALIDSGVAPVDGLRGNVINGPDLSFESQATNLRNLDTFGHGTHLAGIIAGREDGDYPIDKDDTNHFLGVAPDARLVSVKVAAANGATDVSQILAAIDWVVQHRRDDGMNIRVLNLSFGTDATQDYVLDPLTHAVEVAWQKGIFVVVAAGNAGFGANKLNDPAHDPYVMAVGASDHKGTFGGKDDAVASFSSTGDARRQPDVVAPGRSLLSLRVPGSYLDESKPTARVGDTPRLFRGSGTSQAAAVVSGAAALVLQQRPLITPDELKSLLTRTARPLPGATKNALGTGIIQLQKARDEATRRYVQTWPRASGVGSLELSRGSLHVTDAGVTLRGEMDVFGKPFVGITWATAASAGSTWSGGDWNGSTWSGSTWSGSTWSGSTWSGSTWSGSTWSGSTWSNCGWAGEGWASGGWLGVTWG